MPTPEPGIVRESCEDSFRSIASACAMAIDAALAVFLETDDPAGPHKARVALRRLTSALDAFSSILRRRAASDLRSRAKRMFRDLGKVRDSDVHLHGDPKPTEDIVARNRKLRAGTRARLRKGRLVGFTQALCRLVNSNASLFRRSNKALERRKAPVHDLAADTLSQAWTACARYGRSVRAIPEAKRHEFRKDMKTLRYLAEFFEGQFPALQDDPFRSNLRDMQDALGDWNDYVVALRIEGRKVPKEVPPKIALALATAEERWKALCLAELPWAAQDTRRP